MKNTQDFNFNLKPIFDYAGPNAAVTINVNPHSAQKLHVGDILDTIQERDDAGDGIYVFPGGISSKIICRALNQIVLIAINRTELADELIAGPWLEELIMYCQNSVGKHVEKKHEVTPPTKKLKLKQKREFTKSNPRMTKQKIKKAIKLFKAGDSIYSIAKNLGVWEGSVYYALEKNGFNPYQRK